MHGVPADLDLSQFVGAELARIDTGHTLRIFDSSRLYESFSIEPPGVYV
jgi:hypothetical protein